MLRSQMNGKNSITKFNTDIADVKKHMDQARKSFKDIHDYYDNEL